MPFKLQRCLPHCYWRWALCWSAAVSSVGLAAVTALIGAGGLGSILFEGLFANAEDVVLLGVLPIIALGLLVDALFKVLMGLARRRVHPW